VFFQEQLFRSSFLLIAHGIFAIPLLFQMTDTRMLVVHCGLYTDWPRSLQKPALLSSKTPS
jgi:hypothetical protein